jgi:hypothetical protein
VIEGVKTVLAGFLGIRRRATHDRAAAAITPVQVIVTGIVLAALFVFTLIAIVRIVLS